MTKQAIKMLHVVHTTDQFILHSYLCTLLCTPTNDLLDASYNSYIYTVCIHMHGCVHIVMLQLHINRLVIW